MAKNQKQKASGRTKEQYLKEADEFHERFRQSLVVKRIDVASVSTTAKTPFKALVLRESLFYRMTELCGVAIDLYRQCKVVSGVIITRSLFETAALCYYVCKHLEEVIKSNNLGDVDEVLMRAGHGGRRFSVGVKAFNPSTTIGELDKEYNGAKNMYGFLCELTHPNWMGCEGAYSDTNYEEYYIEFSEACERVPESTGLNELLMGLTIFEHYYNKMGNFLPKFIEMCEAEIAKRSSQEEGEK